MNIFIEEEVDINFDFDYIELINRVILFTMDFEKCPYEAEINVILTNNDNIHQVNYEFRQIDRPTDVLSFPMVDYETPADFDFLEEADEYFNPETGELLLGDIMISIEKVKSQAKEFGHSEKRELGFLVAHSMLHLFGYDHMTEQEAEIMEARQKQIMEELEITI